jgi:hypothetical protein
MLNNLSLDVGHISHRVLYIDKRTIKENFATVNQRDNQLKVYFAIENKSKCF